MVKLLWSRDTAAGSYTAPGFKIMGDRKTVWKSGANRLSRTTGIWRLYTSNLKFICIGSLAHCKARAAASLDKPSAAPVE